MTLFNTLFCTRLASSVYQKGNLSHAIMTENKGDEVLCTKKGWDQRAVMKTNYSRRQLRLQNLWEAWQYWGEGFQALAHISVAPVGTAISKIIGLSSLEAKICQNLLLPKRLWRVCNCFREGLAYSFPVVHSIPIFLEPLVISSSWDHQFWCTHKIAFQRVSESLEDRCPKASWFFLNYRQWRRKA